MLYHKALRALHYGAAAIPCALCFTSLPVPPVPLQPPDRLAYGKLSQWVLMLPRLSTLCMEKTILFPSFFPLLSLIRDFNCPSLHHSFNQTNSSVLYMLWFI
jgi:hypothetical protein